MNKNNHYFTYQHLQQTCAYTWVCLAKAEGVRDTKFLLGISVDARRRLEQAPIPGNYFGNCMGRRVLVAERNEPLWP
jgi:hypothetical protein